MNHLEGEDEILGRITPAFIEFTKQQNKKYKKSIPTYIKRPIISYQIEQKKKLLDTTTKKNIKH